MLAVMAIAGMVVTTTGCHLTFNGKLGNKEFHKDIIEEKVDNTKEENKSDDSKSVQKNTNSTSAKYAVDDIIDTTERYSGQDSTSYTVADETKTSICSGIAGNFSSVNLDNYSQYEKFVLSNMPDYITEPSYTLEDNDDLEDSIMTTYYSPDGSESVMVYASPESGYECASASYEIKEITLHELESAVGRVTQTLESLSDIDFSKSAVIRDILEKIETNPDMSYCQYKVENKDELNNVSITIMSIGSGDNMTYHVEGEAWVNFNQ